MQASCGKYKCPKCPELSLHTRFTLTAFDFHIAGLEQSSSKATNNNHFCKWHQFPTKTGGSGQSRTLRAKLPGVFNVGFLIVFETSLGLSLTQKMRLACCLGHTVQIQGSTTKGIRSTAAFRDPAFTRALCVKCKPRFDQRLLQKADALSCCRGPLH